MTPYFTSVYQWNTILKEHHYICLNTGAFIQSLVEHCKALPTKEERNEMANAIIAFIGQRNPHLRDEENYNHKLWDHLFILADYNLDVDSPYPIPTAEELQQKPKKLEYPSL